MPTETGANVDRGLRPKRGQKVFARDGEAIGDVLGLITRQKQTYLYVMRYGPGMDEVYIPLAAVERIVGDHVYLDLDALDLLGAIWHELPGSETSAPGTRGE